MLDEQDLAAKLSLDKVRFQEFLSISETKVFKKNTTIFDGRTTCNWLGYIINGAVRTYCINDRGEDISFLLQVNGDFFGDYESYITGHKAEFIIEALLDCEVLIFEKTALERLMESDIFWLKFGRQMADIVFLEAKHRITDLLFYNPEQRYQNLLQKSPEVMRKIPQKYISSYLGITPQSLSRIRKRIIN
ncbi:MAG: Crp/Fnr family transcriptional regulator [Chitinophaga sp.]|uniref:Crp/Fnr family transcriptional regulator n=1 Tax=Chitinophaga sp. TaxID=1869181 RepID=UPI001B032CAC|nr:Crp/Fnr family transcriptional regulator [Chitinophaga sp.]MBO9732999.1 Crp/Fnr family transcriptional regulator [Chitinophaga sp.]